MTDITFTKSASSFVKAMLTSLKEILRLSDEQLASPATDFNSCLPEYLKNVLHPER